MSQGSLLWPIKQENGCQVTLIEHSTNNLQGYFTLSSQSTLMTKFKHFSGANSRISQNRLFTAVLQFFQLHNKSLNLSVGKLEGVFCTSHQKINSLNLGWSLCTTLTSSFSPLSLSLFLYPPPLLPSPFFSPSLFLSYRVGIKTFANKDRGQNKLAQIQGHGGGQE